MISPPWPILAARVTGNMRGHIHLMILPALIQPYIMIVASDSAINNYTFLGNSRSL